MGCFIFMSPIRQRFSEDFRYISVRPAVFRDASLNGMYQFQIKKKALLVRRAFLVSRLLIFMREQLFLNGAGGDLISGLDGMNIDLAGGRNARMS